MTLELVELRRVGLPLVVPFRTSFGTEIARDALLVRVVVDGVEGWGECVAMSEPLYSSEWVDGAQLVTQQHLVPLLFAADRVTADGVADALRSVKGHRMAKAGLEMAILTAELTAAGVSLATHLGGVRDAVDAGVSIGIPTSVGALLETVEQHLGEGYRRIKLKVEPGWDVEPVRAVRERWPDILLQVDANTAYTLADAEHLAELDPFDLLLLEQPLAEEDITGHAALARRLRTPVCLDESITSLAVATDALDRGACSIVNIKPGRVGGLLEARRIHDLCVERGVPVWCGGMLETGIGRAANAALASLPGFTLPGDVSASSRWFRTDITVPLDLVDGRLRVPTAPGLGVDILPTELAAATTWVETLRR